ncbi:MAG: tyrosine-type recombinase/integrase, partial [Myxococcales bacterium]|nr:tyrosine-type recombinase/integrase [Myxococcales bacterium]
TVITKLARAGIPVHDIQRFIGHKSIETTLKYIHTEVNHTTIMSIL